MKLLKQVKKTALVGESSWLGVVPICQDCGSGQTQETTNECINK